MKLNLANPIVFFDLETTGINIAKDRIVEISVLKVYPNGKEEQKTIRVNPGMHIPEEASAIHGIYDEDVKDAPMFITEGDSASGSITCTDVQAYCPRIGALYRRM